MNILTTCDEYLDLKEADTREIITSFDLKLSGDAHDKSKEALLRTNELHYSFSNPTQFSANFTQFPPDIWLEMLAKLSIFDADNLCMINKVLRNFCSNSTWQRVFQLKYPAVYEEFMKWNINKVNYREVLHNIEQGKFKTLESIIYGIYSENFNRFVLTNKSFLRATRHGHLDIVKYLMSLPEKYNINPATGNNKSIRLAAGNGYLDIVKYLMSLPEEYKIDPSIRSNEAIYLAVNRGHVNVVEYLMSLPLECGIDSTATNKEAIYSAAASGHVDMVKFLISLSVASISNS